MMVVWAGFMSLTVVLLILTAYLLSKHQGEKSSNHAAVDDDHDEPVESEDWQHQAKTRGYLVSNLPCTVKDSTEKQ